MKIDLV